MDCLDELKDIVKTSKSGIAISNRIRANKRIFDFIVEKTPLLNQLRGCPIITRVYWILNNVNEFPLCGKCGKPVIKQCGLDGYKKIEYCSHKCSASSDENRKKITEGFIKKYGKNYRQELGKITSAGMIKKYGVKSSVLVPELKEKIRQTLLEKYGTDNISSIPEVRNKIKQSMQERYGVDHFTNFKKCKETMLQKYGVEHNSKLKYVQNKRVETIKEKMKQHGVEWTSQLQRTKNKVRETFKSRFYNDVLLKDPEYIPLFSCEDYVNSKSTDRFKFHCTVCGKDFQNLIFIYAYLYYKCKENGEIFSHRTRCPYCYPKLSGTSHPEQEIYQFVKSILPEETKVLNSIRTVIPPKELDIYIPFKDLAIEFNGLYWHSDNIIPDHNYHLNKTIECEKQGIQLIHIFEDEWVHKQDIVKSIIKSKLGIFDRSIYARECEVKEVKHKECRDFLNSNHIQGSCNSSINLGLYYNGELVSIMTFGKSRYNKQYKYEMYRFCNLLSTKVIGGASKLLSYFIKQNDTHSIITYCDRRFSNGHLYDILGMKKLYETQPNYFYVIDESVRESRLKYQKHKLKKLLENYDPKLNEYENMTNNGYFRIYDCGNYAYGF